MSGGGIFNGWTRGLVTFGLAAGLLALALRGTDWPALGDALTGFDVGWLALALGVQLCAMLARGLRWNVLLSASGHSSFTTAFFGEMFGYLGNNFLPARAGEAMRAYAVGRKTKGGISFVLGTIAMERLSDAVFMSLAAFVMVLLLPGAPVWLQGGAATLFIAGIGVILVLAFIAQVRDRILKPMARFPRLKPLVGKAKVLLGRFSHGTQTLYEPHRLGAFVGLTFVVWTFDVVALIILAKGLGITLEPPQALLFQAAIALSKSVPSTPGYVGVYQAVAVSVLPPFGFTHAQALAYVLIYQAALMLQSVAWGLPGWFLLRSKKKHGRPAKRKRTRRKKPPPPVETAPAP